MTDEKVLVLDAGTSSARCHVFDRSGKGLSSASCGWSYIDEPDASSMSRAFDPEAVWRSFCSLIASCMRDAKAQPRDIAAISVTSQRQAVVFLDSSHREVYAGPNLDLRAVFEGAAIDDEMRDRVYRTTGHLPSLLFAPAKLLWFEAHRPEAYQRIAYVLTLADWLRWRLTGEISSELTLTAEAGLLDIRERKWCSDLLRDMGLVTTDIPLVEAGTLAGTVTARASAETGLPEGTLVAVAPADTQAGLLGLGVARENQVGIVAGWSVPIQMITPEAVMSPKAGVWTGCFPGSRKWVLESNLGDAGNSYGWLAKTLFGDAADRYTEMDSVAAESPVGSDGAFAFLGPPRMDVNRLGMSLGGFLFPVPLTLGGTVREHLVRATLEAIAYAVKSNFRQVEGAAGTPAQSVALGGGMIRTKTWPKIVADVLDEEVMVSPTPEVTALGAYLCASTSLGEFASVEEAAQSVGPRLRSEQPDPVSSAEYTDLYERWTELSAELQVMGV